MNTQNKLLNSGATIVAVTSTDLGLLLKEMLVIACLMILVVSPYICQDRTVCFKWHDLILFS